MCANIIKLSIVHSLNLFCVYIQTHLEKWGPAGPRTKSPTNGTWRETTRERRTQFSCESIVSRSRHFVETIIQPFISLDTYRVELLNFDIDFCLPDLSYSTVAEAIVSISKFRNFNSEAWADCAIITPSGSHQRNNWKLPLERRGDERLKGKDLRCTPDV